MASEKDRFEKILALAIDPAAYEGEAVAALRKAYELVRRHSSPATPPAPPPSPAPSPAPPGDASLEFKVTRISSFWLHTFLNSVSEKAYGLGLKSKTICDPLITQTPMTIYIRCDGPQKACNAFRAHLKWLIDYINSQPPQTSLVS